MKRLIFAAVATSGMAIVLLAYPGPTMSVVAPEAAILIAKLQWQTSAPTFNRVLTVAQAKKTRTKVQRYKSQSECEKAARARGCKGSTCCTRVEGARGVVEYIISPDEGDLPSLPERK